VVSGLSGIESDSFRSIPLRDSGAMHDDLHPSEPDRIDRLFHDPEPIDRPVAFSPGSSMKAAITSVREHI